MGKSPKQYEMQLMMINIQAECFFTFPLFCPNDFYFIVCSCQRTKKNTETINDQSGNVEI